MIKTNSYLHRHLKIGIENVTLFKYDGIDQYINCMNKIETQLFRHSKIGIENVTAFKIYPISNHDCNVFHAK